METTKTSSEILLEAADLLEQEGKWCKGNYFRETNQGCSMCAHGAIAFCGDAKIKKLVSQKINPAKYEVNASPMVYNELAHLPNNDHVTIIKYYGELGLAHYKAAQVGLTFIYNDRPNTTKQDVINKLREAALL